MSFQPHLGNRCRDFVSLPQAGKKNSKQKNVAQPLLMVKQISPMETDTLKGTPDKLSTFLIRLLCVES